MNHNIDVDLIISGHGVIGGPSGVSTVEMERTLKSLNGYHEVEVHRFTSIFNLIVVLL